MRLCAESLNDARKPLHRLKAIMLGPLLMAGKQVVGGWVGSLSQLALAGCIILWRVV